MGDDKPVSLEKPPESDKAAPRRPAKHRSSSGGGRSRWDWAGDLGDAVGDILEAVFVRWWAD